MGCCCYNEQNPDGTRNCSNVAGPESCPAGLYMEGPCPGIAQCFFMGQLSSYVAEQTSADLILALAAQPMFTVLFDFRDLILKKSAIGREFLALYRAHGEPALEALRHHPALLRRVLTALTRAAIYAQDALRAHAYSSKDVAAGAMKITPKMAAELQTVLRDFAALPSTHDFGPMLTHFGELVGRLEGRTTREILHVLAVEPPHATTPAA